MDNIENLKTDAQIADILNKLKAASNPSSPQVPVVHYSDYNKEEVVKPKAEDTTKETPPIEDTSDIEQSNVKDSPVEENISVSADPILPWFRPEDRDTKKFHYIKSGTNGSLEYGCVSADHSSDDLAALRLKNDYLCDLDYYNSPHYVLFVKQIEGDSDQFGNSYYHYYIFTDNGIADFNVPQDAVPYPFYENDLNKWFETVSNYNLLSNPKFNSNHNAQLLESVDGIRDFKYDIITMNRPGVFTLDSIDNDDADYQLCIKVKDKYGFIPINKIIECLKYYAVNKSTDELKSFVNMYFDVV